MRRVGRGSVIQERDVMFRSGSIRPIWLTIVVKPSVSATLDGGGLSP
jgi:hypothetical protein